MNLLRDPISHRSLRFLRAYNSLFLLWSHR